VPSRLIVLNEWLLHDLRGDNGRDFQSQSFEFLQALIQKPDRIAVLRASPWVTKAYNLMKHHDPLVLEIAKLLHKGILLDLSKCLQLNRHDLIPLPVALQHIELKEDKYLFDLCHSANADLIVTSDTRLIEKVALIEEIRLALRQEFLSEYLA